VKHLRANFVFQGKRKLLKNPECKKYVQYSEKFKGKLCFSGQAESCSKILNVKKYIQYSVFSVYSLGSDPFNLG